MGGRARRIGLDRQLKAPLRLAYDEHGLRTAFAISSTEGGVVPRELLQISEGDRPKYTSKTALLYWLAKFGVARNFWAIPPVFCPQKLTATMPWLLPCAA